LLLISRTTLDFGLAELTEYTLAFLASCMVGAFAFTSFAGVTSATGATETRAQFSELTAAAVRAGSAGGATVLVKFNNASLYCQGRTLFLRTDGYTLDQLIPLKCDFVLKNLSGMLSIRFEASNGTLVAEAT
jgi:hypothetical protein